MINPYVDRNFYSNSSSSSSPSLFQSSQRNRSSSLIRSITSSSTISNWSLESNCGDINFINDRDQQCNFSRTVIECLDDDGFINYIQLTYCTIQSEYYSLALLAFILLILFFSIGTNADDFLCPVLIAISKSLKLSDNIAGVTFLAFGNGAPDIFSSIIGITDANPNLVIGQLYGAGIFVTTVVVGSIMLTREFEIMKRPLMRDIIFYLITTTLVWTTFLERKILIYHSILFIIIYIVYVFVVIVSGYIYKRNLQNQSSMISVNRMMPRENLNLQKKYKINGPQNSNASLKSLSFVKKFDCDEGVVLTRIKHRQYGLDPIHQRRLTLYHIHSDPHHHHHHHHLRQRKENNHLDSVVENSDNIDQNHLPIYSIADKNFVIDSNNNNNNNTNNNNNYDDEQGEMKSIEFWSKDRRLTISDTNFFSSNNKKSDDIDSADAKISSRQNSILNPKMDHCFNEKDSKKRDVNSVDGSTLINDQTNFFDWIIDSSRFDSKLFNEMNFFHKISMIIKAPIYLVFTLTIPVVDNELPMRGWIRSLNLAHLIVSPQICLLIAQIKLIDPIRQHLIVLGISLILFVLVYFTSKSDQAPKYHILFAYFGFIVCISWIYAIANEVVNMLDAIRVIFNLSKFMIGLTIGAWGNSIGDFLSNLSMAKNGFPRMAISACFGGPVLNMLLGIGIPYTILFIKQQTYQIDVEYNNMITVLYGTITISLLTTMITLLFLTRFQSTRIHGFLLFALYFCFLVSAIITEWKFN